MKRLVSAVGILAFLGLVGLLTLKGTAARADDPPPAAPPAATEEGLSDGPTTPSAVDETADSAGVVVTTQPSATETVTLQQEGPSQGGAPPTPQAPILDVSSTRLSFQGLLKDAGGVPLVGPVNLRFQIYTHPGGVAVGAPIDVNGVALTNGVADTQVPVPTSSFDGAGRAMGVRINLGAELTPRIQLTAVPYAYRVDRVASEELDDSINLGRGSAPLASGLLNIFNGVQSQESIELSGGAHRISTYGSDGLEQIRLWGPTFGEILLNDNVGNQTTVFLSAQSDSGGRLELRDAAGATRVQVLGDSTGTGGEISVLDDDGTETVEILGAEVAAEGGQILIRNAAGTNTIELDGDSGDAAFLGLRNTAGSNRITLDGDSTGAGLITLYQNDGSSGVLIDGDNGTNVGGRISVNDNVSSARVVITGESAGSGGEVSLLDNDGTETIEILAAEAAAEGGSIKFFRADGTGPTIELDGHFVSGAQPDGRIITDELQITGGSDLSEQFDVKPHPATKVEPGMVVCIDPQQTGKLMVSHKPYDRTVAGIISGAGGVETGLYMGQRGSEEVDGQFPVALTGRVYVWCDASKGSIEPGDLLTTSSTPGHAMKVSDHGKAFGAILGKAMSKLQKDKGLVLVLVSLQ